MRTADDLIARAEADKRGVALMPLSEASARHLARDAGRGGARLRLLKPKPHAVERTEACCRRSAASCGERRRRDRVALRRRRSRRRRANSSTALARLIEQRAVTVVTGGLRPALGARRRRQRGRRAHGARCCAADRRRRAGVVRALDLKGLPLGDAPFASRPATPRPSALFDLPVEIRNDIARLEIACRALGRRGAAARQALAPAHRRRGDRLDRRHRAAAARLDLSISSRALGPFADVRLADRAVAGARRWPSSSSSACR